MTRKVWHVVSRRGSRYLSVPIRSFPHPLGSTPEQAVEKPGRRAGSHGRPLSPLPSRVKTPTPPKPSVPGFHRSSRYAQLCSALRDQTSKARYVHLRTCREERLHAPRCESEIEGFRTFGEFESREHSLQWNGVSNIRGDPPVVRRIAYISPQFLLLAHLGMSLLFRFCDRGSTRLRYAIS